MSRRRRAAVLGGLALALAALAASDVNQQEAALRRRLGRAVAVLVARRPVRAGQPLTADALAVRAVPATYAPGGAYARPGSVLGLRAAVDLPVGAYLGPGAVRAPAPVRAAAGPVARRGERIVDLVARAAPGQVTAGDRVDLVAVRGARASLALQDALVTAVAAAPADGDAAGAPGGARVEVSLLVSVPQALALAGAQSGARELRLLPRPPGDHTRLDATGR